MSHYIKNNKTCILFPDQTSIKTTITISTPGTCEKIDNLIPPRALSITQTLVNNKNKQHLWTYVLLKAFHSTQGWDRLNGTGEMMPATVPAKGTATSKQASCKNDVAFFQAISEGSSREVFTEPPYKPQCRFHPHHHHPDPVGPRRTKQAPGWRMCPIVPCKGD